MSFYLLFRNSVFPWDTAAAFSLCSYFRPFRYPGSWFCIFPHHVTVNGAAVGSLVWIFLDKLLSVCRVAADVELEALAVELR